MNMNFLQHCNFDWIELLSFQERPFRAKLIPSKVWSDLDKYKNNSVGIKNYCKKWRTSVSFFPSTDNKVPYDFISVGGQYCDRRSEVFVYANDFDCYKFTDKTWDRFKYKFIQTLMHELVHFMQYDNRDDEPSYRYYKWNKSINENVNQDREYYSSTDEVQAYAHCVYMDFRYYKPNKSIDKLVEDCVKRPNSPTLREILKTFDFDIDSNETIKNILKEVYRWDRKYKKIS